MRQERGMVVCKLRIDKRCVDENVKMIVNGIRALSVSVPLYR